MNDETLGYTLRMHHKSGGVASTWLPTLENVFEEIRQMEELNDEPDVRIEIILVRYKDRMSVR